MRGSEVANYALSSGKMLIFAIGLSSWKKLRMSMRKITR
jgi:hypothetical protein